ncbi:OmpA family protein [Pontimicrobium sp. IMCC45349]|uniref:OmpA family protein n=1 Tax=Pontimicrobium sp. IMCC45349 TaxID=3391574 RepID=UPI0039A3A704
MKRIILLAFLFSWTHFIAQNLVVNPSFEAYEYCPEYIGRFNYNVASWSTPTLGTTDYFNTCSDNVRKINHAGMQEPKSGKGFAGLYLYSKGDYREYIQGTLKSTLEKDKDYEVSFYISLADYATHAIKHIDVLFMPRPLANYTEEEISIKKLSKQPIQSNFVALNNTQFYQDKTGWIRVSFVYTALGYEKTFILGNFEKNKKQERLKLNTSKSKPFSYYYIDDVSVVPVIKEKLKSLEEPVKIEVEAVIEPNKIYEFKHVLFEFDKAELLEDSIKELDDLYNYLLKQPELNIEIYGHTDNIGTKKHNKDLSTERAKSVAQYLINKGLKEDRILYFGYGSNYPIGNNDYEEGRAQNRRVEFQLKRQ